MAGFSGTESNWIPEARDFSHERRLHSYNLIGHCLEKPNTDFLIRIKQSRSAMREVAKLPMMELDCTMVYNYYHADQRGQASIRNQLIFTKKRNSVIFDRA